MSGFINRFSSQGYDLDESTFAPTVSPYTNYTFNLKTLYEFTENTSLLFSGRYFKENQDYIPTENLSGAFNIREWNTQLKLDHRYSDKWSSYVDFYATRYKTDNYLDNTTEGTRHSDSFYNQLMIRPEVRIVFSPSIKHSIIGRHKHTG